MSSGTAKKRKRDGGGEEGSGGGGALVATVKFNVGGQGTLKYRVLSSMRILTTMLGRLVSDTWNDDPSNPMFIHRNGDIFPYVLD